MYVCQLLFDILHMVKIKHEYDIVIGDEFFDPEFPDMGYKGEICNRKNTLSISIRNAGATS